MVRPVIFAIVPEALIKLTLPRQALHNFRITDHPTRALKMAIAANRAPRKRSFFNGPVGRSVGCLREACSGLTGCLIEHDLHAIRVLESYGFIAHGVMTGA